MERSAYEAESTLTSVWFTTLNSAYPDLLKRCAQEGLYVCVPQSCSLDTAPLTRAMAEHHVLCGVEGTVGEFTTLSRRTVSLHGSRAATGEGWRAPVEAHVLRTETFKVKEGNLHVHFLSRPLEGGMAVAPNTELEGLTPAALSALLGYLHILPDASGPLARFAAQVQALAAEFTGEGEEVLEAVEQWLAPAEGMGQDSSSSSSSSRQGEWWLTCNLALQLQSHISEAAEAIMLACGESLAPPRAGGSSSGGGGASARASASSGSSSGGGSGRASAEALLRRLLLCLQADACRRLHAPVMAHLRRTLSAECSALSAALGGAAAQPHPAGALALGIAPKYLAARHERAVQALGEVATALCPLSKLHALLAAKDCITASVMEAMLQEGVDLADVLLGADDLLPLMSMALVHCSTSASSSTARVAADFPAHLVFIELCMHPMADKLSTGEAANTFGHWHVASSLEAFAGRQ